MVRPIALLVFISGCFPYTPDPKFVPMTEFPASQGDAELEAEVPKIQHALALELPKYEFLRVAPASEEWNFTRNELSGILIERSAWFHAEIRYQGKCYYTRLAAGEEHVEGKWVSAHFTRFGDVPPSPNGPIEWTYLDDKINIKVAPLPCDDIAADRDHSTPGRGSTAR